MCYQKFVSYICGCGTLAVDKPCDFVTHSFTHRVACPNYSSDSYQSNRACSGGEFYCAGSKDAGYLNDLRMQRFTHSSNYQKMDAKLQSDKHTYDVMVRSAEFMKIPREKLREHRTYQTLRSNLISLPPQLNAAKPHIIQLHAAIEEVRHFYSRYGGPHSPNTSMQPTVVIMAIMETNRNGQIGAEHQVLWRQ
jgi:hypothetical protein